MSGEGGEIECLQEYAGKSQGRRTMQPWSVRITNADAQWELQMPHLVDTYLLYKYKVPDTQDEGYDPFKVSYIDLHSTVCVRVVHTSQCLTVVRLLNHVYTISSS